jgi:photosystem II stability/assembly factor-like uncharacterized protein
MPMIRTTTAAIPATAATAATTNATAATARFTILLFILLAALPSGSAAQSGRIDPSLIGDLAVRNIGPANMGGRIHDVEVHPDDPATIWAGHASGGVFKSVNHGTTWEALFDDQVSTSIGDIAIAPSNPSIVYVGTGEQNNRQSSSWGHGIYRTRDGGKTWDHLGLEETHHIGRVQVHPRDPDVVWVAAAGHLWGPNPERGVYLTTDGGATWEKTLYINEDTGVIDLAVDPGSPNILYAAAYQRRRTGFGFNGGGPHGGIYRSTDGGRTWRKLTAGLPTGEVGRIGLDLCRSRPNVVYAIIESRDLAEGHMVGGERQERSELGGVYRSDDRGESWTHQSVTNPRPMYYSQIRVDPNNDLRVWVLDTRMYVSEDGGITWDQGIIDDVHVDHHALWWDPNDSDHIIIGNDGGLDWTWDGGKTWVDMQTVPWAQFYEISADNVEPFYHVMGGLQDNGTWYGNSGNYWRIGITNRDWMTINGGDGFYAVADPADPDIVYAESQGGNVNRRDLATMVGRSIRPAPPPGSGEEYRFNWNSPIVISPHDPARIYFGGNRLFISDDRGDTWRRTGDLTKQIDRNDLEIMGVVNSRIRLSRNDGISTYGNITTISESPHTAGVLWIGTDDGNLKVSRDDGATWTEVSDRIPDLPPRTCVTRVAASRYAAGRAYVTLDGHRNDDFSVYVFVTEDFGRRWTSLSAGVPDGSTASVIREHVRNPDLLFLGTERGAYWSYDRGATWNLFEGGLPRVPVDDIYVHPGRNDLIFGTHARGAWIMDGIGALEGMKDEVFGDPLTLFPIPPAWRYNRSGHLQDQGDFVFIAPNPPYGVVIDYFLPEELTAEDEVSIVITDADGEFVFRMSGTKRRGVNRVVWPFMHSVEVTGEPAQPGEPVAFASSAAEAVPGTYTVTVSAGGATRSESAEVRLDPRLEGRVDLEHMIALRDAQLRIARLTARLDRPAGRLQAVSSQVQELRQFLQRREIPAPVQEIVNAFSGEIRELTERWFAGGGYRSPGGSTRAQLAMINRELSGVTGPLPADVHDRLDAIEAETEEAGRAVEAFLATSVPELNRTLGNAGISFIVPPGIPPVG